MAKLLNNTKGLINMAGAGEGGEDLILPPGVSVDVPDEALKHPVIAKGLKSDPPIFKSGASAKKSEDPEAAAIIAADTTKK